MAILLQAGILFWVVIVMTFVALVVFIDRLLRLRKISVDPQDFLPGVFNVLDKGQTAEALAICDETPGPMSALVAEVITHHDSEERYLREILATTAHAELSRLERRTMLLSLFAQLLPLVGLIGTFVGGLTAVSALDAQAPLVETGAIVQAVSGALCVTIAGLVGAALCYAAHHILLLRIDALSLNMDVCMALLLEHLAYTAEGAGDGR